MNKKTYKTSSTEKIIVYGIFIPILIVFIGFLIVIGAIIVKEAINSNVLNSIPALRYLDPCERNFDVCNRQCGEGWFSGLCKTSCTDEYHNCLRKRL